MCRVALALRVLMILGASCAQTQTWTQSDSPSQSPLASRSVSATRSLSSQTVSASPSSTTLPSSQVCGSIAFQGTATYLTAVGLPMYFPGDFTIELWALSVDTSTPYPRLWSVYPRTSTGISQNFIELSVDNTISNDIYLGVMGTEYVAGPDASLLSGQWHHFAVVRYGAQITLYIDGSPFINVHQSAVIGDGTATLRVGGVDPSALSLSQWQGNIADFRVVQGQAIYTG